MLVDMPKVRDCTRRNNVDTFEHKRYSRGERILLVLRELGFEIGGIRGSAVRIVVRCICARVNRDYSIDLTRRLLKGPC